MVYQRAAFGSVFHPSYAYYPQGAFAWMTHGYLGLTYPRIDVALKLLFGCRRGLLFTGPVVLAAPFGLRMLWQQPATHTAAVTAAGVATYYFLFHASFSSWPAGWSYGPRYMSITHGQFGGSLSRRWLLPASGLHSWPFRSGRSRLMSFIAHCASSIGRRSGPEDFR
jgi:hypothetical protein